MVFNQLAGVIDVQNGTNGLELAFQGGGNFTGGYITTNKFGLTVLAIGSFNVNGTVTGTNTWQDTGNLVGANVINGALTWVGGDVEQRRVCDHRHQQHAHRDWRRRQQRHGEHAW